MKPLYQLSNREKATILFSLFPEAMPKLVEFITETADITLKDDTLRKSWDDDLFTYDFYMVQVRQVCDNARKYGDKLSKSSRLFADYLFGGHVALFTNRTLVRYVTIIRHDDPKFTKAVDLLFNP